MKKAIISVLTVLIIAAAVSCAIYFYIGYKDSKKEINLNGSIFSLKYSDCSRLSDTCINKYYKEDEFGDDWSELISLIYIKPVSDPHLYSNFLKKEKSAMYLKQEKSFDIVTYANPYVYNKNKYLEQNTSKVMNYATNEGIIVFQISSRYLDPIKYIKEKEIKKAAKQLQKMHADKELHLKFLTPMNSPEMYFRKLNNI